jgi:hypothetical protein
VCDLAQAAAGQTGSDGLRLAATAHNKAALIASDCGLPDLARSLCHRQSEVYLRARPLDAQAARYALEPLVNLARLHIRSGDNDGAYQLLDTLYQAVRSRTDTVIDGTPMPSGELTESGADHHTLCQWLWTVLLADGSRALASAGRWDQALAHAEQHHGVGHRLLDGRQITILARCLAGDPASALALIEESLKSEPWEQPVAACLTVLCLRTGARPADTATTGALEQYLKLEPAPELIVFRTRLGLTVIDLAGDLEQPSAARAAARLVTEAVTARDGYAARDVLAHEECRAHLTSTQERTLSVTLRASGLGSGVMPEDLMADLRVAVKTSEKTTERNLAGD